MLQVYLDNSATTPVDPQVVAAMEPYWQTQFGNPSSPHRLGIEAESVLSQCRKFLAQLFNVRADELYFTSGGTESNNLAILGYAYAQYQPGHIITSKIEHLSVLNPIAHLEESCGWRVSRLPADRWGKIDPQSVAEAISPDTALISIMLVNNEIGSIQAVEQIGQIIAAANRNRRQKIVFHVDACQALGSVPIDIKGSKIDLLSVSGHKIFGPKGTGLLYIKDGLLLRPLLFGGGQEGGLRSGTENLPGIVGLAKACELAFKEFEKNKAAVAELKDRLILQLLEIPDSLLNSPADGADHIISVRFAGIKGEVLVHFLEQHGVYVSMGAACSSRKSSISHVLKAIGLTPDEAAATIRIGLSPKLTTAQIDYAAEKIAASVAEVRSIYG
ncbi:MAG: cysteine desulfurase [Firmicutes bacterium]|nr:cysteine desulfurase [Bacillota bacterium]